MIEYLSDYIIKFCQKQEYVDDILSGRIFMNELSVFNKIDDSFRGDEYDGMRVIKMSPNTVAKIEWRGEALTLPIDILSQSHVGINKIPVFNACLLNEKNLQRVTDSTFKFCPIFIKHMEQFGEHVVLLSKSEFAKKMETYVIDNNMYMHNGNIKYVDIETPPPKADTWEDSIREYVFVKTLSEHRNYDLQNEWRLAITYPQIIPECKSFYVADIGKLQYALQLPLQAIKEGVLRGEANP